MSVATLISCPEIQEELNQVFELDPTTKRENNPLTEFLLSPMNVGNVQLQKSLSPGNGKSKIVELIYTPRLLESAVQESEGHDDCTATNVATELSEQYDVGTDYFQTSEVMPMAQLRYKCEQNDMYLGRLLNRLIDQLMRKIETFNFEQLALLKGKFSSDIVGTVDGSDDYAVATLTAAGTFNFDLYQKVVAATKYSGYAMNPIIVGGFNIENYFTAAKAGCCSASGVNLQELYNKYGMAVLSSYRADNAFGDANHFLALEPSAAQMIYWNEYEGPNGINHYETEIFKQMVIVDPMTGLPLDLKINVDCNGIASIFVRSYNKLVGMPTDMFQASDRLNGVTFINGFKIVNS